MIGCRELLLTMVSYRERLENANQQMNGGIRYE